MDFGLIVWSKVGLKKFERILSKSLKKRKGIEKKRKEKKTNKTDTLTHFTLTAQPTYPFPARPKQATGPINPSRPAIPLSSHTRR
jgi:hypothetical protein